MIFPDDPGFETGTYQVLLVNRDEDEDEFTHQPLAVCFTLTKVPRVVDLTDMNAPIQATCSSDNPCFFKYSIKDGSDLEELLILLNLSERKRLTAYIHWTTYPSQKKNEHGFCVGALPAEPFA